jgi:mono/diheme cytochrome c family protein
MHALLKWMQALDPSLGWVGAIGIPSAFLALAGLLPFLGRGKWAIVWTRGFGLALALFVVVAFAQFGSQMQSPFSRALASAETDTASEDAPTESDAETVDARRRELGARLFQREGCRNCHSIGGEGANGPGPALDGIGDERRSRAWFVSFLKDPSSQGATLMPPYGHLSAEELNALAEFLWSQKRK